jgi:hypothetical protein
VETLTLLVLLASPDTCPMADILCPREGHTATDACKHLGETVKAVRARTIEIMKKECGSECACTAGTCAAPACDGCASIKTQIFAPLLKERLAKPHAGCTLTTGPLCAPCVEELSAASYKKLGDFVLEKIGPTLAVVKSSVKDRAAKAGLAPCCDGEKACAPCAEIKKAVVYPHVKERMLDKAGHDGRPCVFLKGEACGPCAQVLTDKVWALLKK